VAFVTAVRRGGHGVLFGGTDVTFRKKAQTAPADEEEGPPPLFTPRWALEAIGNWENGTWVPWGDVSGGKRPECFVVPGMPGVVCLKATLKKSGPGKPSVTCGSVVDVANAGRAVVLETFVPKKGKALTAVMVLADREVQVVGTQSLKAAEGAGIHEWPSEAVFDADCKEGRVALLQKIRAPPSSTESTEGQPATTLTRSGGAAPVEEDERNMLQSNAKSWEAKATKLKMENTDLKAKLKAAEERRKVAEDRVKALEKEKEVLVAARAKAEGKVEGLTEALKAQGRERGGSDGCGAPGGSRGSHRDERKRSRSRSRSPSRSRERHVRGRRSPSPPCSCSHCRH
jgi:hypothetical protein